MVPGIAGNHSMSGVANSARAATSRRLKASITVLTISTLSCTRLPLQARRPQRLAVIEVATDASNPAAAKIDDYGLRLSDRDAAAFATSLKPREEEHAVAEITKLLADQTHLLPGIVERLKEPFDSLASPVAIAPQCARHRREPVEI